jgi:hypothetical protein
MTIILADGYWMDDQHQFFGKRISLGDWDGIEDEKDENIFYYLEGAPILGKHGEFVITNYEYERELHDL